MWTKSTARSQMAVLGVVLSLVLISGCDMRNGEVHYRIPNDLVGVFVLVEDRNNGMDVGSARRFTIDIPADGICRVVRLDFLRKFHVLTAAYTSGRQLVHPV